MPSKKIVLAAMGPRMIRLAATHADRRDGSQTLTEATMADLLRGGDALAVLVAALMGGTAAVNLVNAKPLFGYILFGPYLAVAAWAGLWLRDARLRALLPIRR